MAQAPASAHYVCREKWRILGPLTIDKLADAAPWAFENMDWSRVVFRSWNNKYGNLCIGTVLKDNKQQHGVVRTIKPGYGMVEAQWYKGEYHGYIRWIRKDGLSGNAVYKRGRKL